MKDKLSTIQLLEERIREAENIQNGLLKRYNKTFADKLQLNNITLHIWDLRKEYDKLTGLY